MKVKSIELWNFRGIRKMKLDFSGRMTVLVGINGMGKTSILEATAILLSRLIGRIVSEKGTGRLFAEGDITNEENETANSIFVEFQGRQVDWRVTKARRLHGRQKITNLEQIKSIVDAVREGLNQRKDSSLPLCVFYGVNRAVIDVPLRIRQNHDFSQVTAYDQALTLVRNDFRLFFEWFRKREDLENEIARGEPAFLDFQLQAVRKAIHELTGFTDIKIRRSPLRMEIKKTGQLFDVRQMSDGEKCLLALSGDIARRIAIANPSLINPLEGEGVILIDEIDLHLHPKWQRVVIQKLPRVFPKCQFIVSTHSPEAISEVEGKDLRCLFKDKTNGMKFFIPRQARGLDVNGILAEIMDAKPRNEKVEKSLENIFRLIDEDKLREAKENISKLSNELNGPIPELVRAEGFISMLESGKKDG